MGTCVVKIKDAYMVWSTVVDAPLVVNKNLHAIQSYIQSRFGEDGLREWPHTLKRLQAKGTSMRGDDSLADTVGFNRAGPDESCLTIDELYDAFVLGKPVHGHKYARSGWEANDD